MSTEFEEELANWRDADIEELETNDEFAFAKKDENGTLTMWKGKVEVNSVPPSFPDDLDLDFYGDMYQIRQVETIGDEMSEMTDLYLTVYNNQLEEYFPEDEYHLLLNQNSPRRSEGKPILGSYSWETSKSEGTT